LLAIGLILGCLGLAGCGADARVTAIEKAITGYPAEHPEVYQVQVTDLSEQLKDLTNEKQFSATVTAEVIDPDKISIDDLLSPGGELELDPITTAGADISYSQLRAYARTRLTELVTAMSDPPLKELSFPVTAAQGKDGWEAQVSGSPTTGEFDAELVSAGMVRTRTWAELAVKAAPHKWKGLLFPDTDTDFLSSVSLTRIAAPPSGNTDEVQVSLAWPEIGAIYQDAAQAAFDSYNKQDGPIFGEISEEDFEAKMSSQTTSEQPDTQTGTAVLKVNTITTAGFPTSATLDELESLVSTCTDVSVVSTDVKLDKTPQQAKSEAMKPLLKKLNEEKVVKEEKMPTSAKVLMGTSSGSSVTIVAGAAAQKNNIITLFKGESSTVQIRVFIPKGSKITVRVPAGKYTVNVASGDTYYGAKYRFGPDGSYSNWVGLQQIKSGYTHTLTFSMSSGGTIGNTGADFDY
jgi:hypothetical protein